MDTDSLYIQFKNGKCFDDNNRKDLLDGEKFKQLEEG